MAGRRFIDGAYGSSRLDANRRGRTHPLPVFRRAPRVTYTWWPRPRRDHGTRRAFAPHDRMVMTDRASPVTLVTRVCERQPSRASAPGSRAPVDALGLARVLDPSASGSGRSDEPAGALWDDQEDDVRRG